MRSTGLPQRGQRSSGTCTISETLSGEGGLRSCPPCPSFRPGRLASALGASGTDAHPLQLGPPGPALGDLGPGRLAAAQAAGASLRPLGPQCGYRGRRGSAAATLGPRDRPGHGPVAGASQRRQATQEALPQSAAHRMTPALRGRARSRRTGLGIDYLCRGRVLHESRKVISVA